jgi:hypothetical protein
MDHAVPFVARSRLHRWSPGRTLAVTAVAGVGHVLSAVLIGLGALALGLAAEQLAPLEAMRGNVSLFILVSLGLAHPHDEGVHRQRAFST